jgi:microcystin-dependent protein
MSNQYLGEIRPFAGSFAIAGWVMCNGQLVSIAQYDALYALIGTTYGGDGVSTFGIPDLRGRVAISQGQGPGLTNRVLGTPSGTEQVTVSIPQMPQHTHSFTVTTVPATATTPTNNLLATPSSPTQQFLYLAANPPAPAPVSAPPAADSVQGQGGNQPHENIMPTLAVTYIMAVTGIFPTQN